MAEETESVLDDDEDGAELSLHSAGELLRRAREQKNLSIEDISKTTRIPQRHLSSIESGDFAALPGRTYAIGFAKSYARAVGLSDASIGTQLREEMDDQGHGAYEPETSGYSPADPGNIPPKMIAWTAAGIGALVLVGYLIWRTLILEPSGTLEPSADDPLAVSNGEQLVSPQSGGQNAPDAGPIGPTLSPNGTVVLTATETVWLKIYDAEGERLFESEMTAGDKYEIPADANDPQIVTGRPDAITVTIDDVVVPALGTGEYTIKDVGVSAAALLAREEGAEPANIDEDQQSQDDGASN